MAHTQLTGQWLNGQDNEWRRVIGFLTSVVDGKLSRVEMEEFSDELEVKLRCIAGRLSDVQSKVDDDVAAAGTKKARCLSCDKIAIVERTQYDLRNILLRTAHCHKIHTCLRTLDTLHAFL